MRVMRTLIVGGILTALALAVYWKITIDERQRTINELNALNAQMELRLAQRQAMIERLSRSRRIAHVQVLDQTARPDGSIASSTVLFIELDDRGAELARQTFTVPGDVLFIDAWTAKFEFDSIAQGDPFMGKTLILLRRIYSDQMSPIDGISIDTPGGIPPGYAGSEAARFEQSIWRNFWELASNPEKAAQSGVRVVQGEAVYKPVRTGQCYELIVDNAGGMSLTPMAPDETTVMHVDG